MLAEMRETDAGALEAIRVDAAHVRPVAQNAMRGKDCSQEL